jgi:hypothetical protein
MDNAAGQGVVWIAGSHRKDDGGMGAGPLDHVNEVG